MLLGQVLAGYQLVLMYHNQSRPASVITTTLFPVIMSHIISLEQ